MPAARITLPHFFVSSLSSLPKSAGVIVTGSLPSSASLAFIAGSARPALISLFSLSTMSAGVFLGALTPVSSQQGRLVAGQDITDGWQVGKSLRTRRRGDGQRAQLASPDV